LAEQREALWEQLARDEGLPGGIPFTGSKKPGSFRDPGFVFPAAISG
jgi:hypothetical protein